MTLFLAPWERTLFSKWVFSSFGTSVGLLTRYDGEIREPLVQCQRSQASMRVARQIASLLWSHGRDYPDTRLSEVSSALQWLERNPQLSLVRSPLESLRRSLGAP